MGCPNFFKYHPGANIHDYMEKFDIDSYDQAVKEIKSFNLGHENEEKIIKSLPGSDVSFQDERSKDSAAVMTDEPGLYAEKRSEKNRDREKSEQYNNDRGAQDLYVREIKKMFEEIYEDPDIDDERLDEFVETVYGKLKEIYSSEDDKESGNYGKEDDLSREEEIEIIMEMMKDIDSEEFKKMLQTELLVSESGGWEFRNFP